MTGRRRVGAIARYKAAARAIRRARAKGLDVAPAVAPVSLRRDRVTDEWGLYHGAIRIAGPFDSPDDALEWAATEKRTVLQ